MSLHAGINEFMICGRAFDLKENLLPIPVQIYQTFISISPEIIFMYKCF